MRKNFIAGDFLCVILLTNCLRLLTNDNLYFIIGIDFIVIKKTMICNHIY